jgi:hypothetical protein
MYLLQQRHWFSTSNEWWQRKQTPPDIFIKCNDNNDNNDNNDTYKRKPRFLRRVFYILSISPTFYEQLFCHYSFVKKLQTQSEKTENLCVKPSLKNCLQYVGEIDTGTSVIKRSRNSFSQIWYLFNKISGIICKKNIYIYTGDGKCSPQ